MKKRSLTIRKFFNYALVASLTFFTPQIASADIQSIQSIQSVFEKVSGKIKNSTQALVQTSVSLTGEISKNIGNVKDLANDVVETTIATVSTSVAKSSEKATQFASTQSASVTSALNGGLEKVYGFAIDKTADALVPFFIRTESVQTPSLTIQNFSTTPPKQTQVQIADEVPKKAQLQNQGLTQSTVVAQKVSVNRVLSVAPKPTVNDILVQSIFRRLATLESKKMLAGPIHQYITNTYTGGAPYSVPADTTSYTNTTINSTVNSAVTGGSSAFSGASLTVTGNVTANSFYGDGSNLTGISSFSTSTTRSVFSSSATGLTYSSTTGAFSLTSGYSIPLTASTTEWTNKVGSQWTTNANGTDIYYSVGNVGIGTTTPGYALTVAGDVSLTGALRANGNAGTSGMVLQTTGTGAQWVATSSLGFGSSLSGGTNGYLSRWTSDSTLSTGLFLDNGTVAGVNATSSSYTFNVKGASGINPFNVASSTGTSLFTVLANGNVGVGTTTPGYGFVIVGNNDSSAKGPLYISSTNASTLGAGFNLDATASGGRNYSIFSGGSGSYNPNGWAVYDSTSNAYRLSVNASGYTTVGTITAPSDSSASQLGVKGNTSIGSTYFAIAAPTNGLIVEGNVGVGTTTPSAKLAITGTAGTGDIFAIASSTNTGYFKVKSTGSVGVGVVNPTSRLHIGDFGTPVSGAKITIEGYDAAVGSYQFNISNAVGAGTVDYKFSIVDVAGGSKDYMYFDSSSGNIGFGTSTPSAKIAITGTAGTGDIFAIASSTNARLFTVTSAGDVGIGTTTPASKFAVVGTSTFDGVVQFSTSTAQIRYGSANLLLASSTGATIYLGGAGNTTQLGGQNIGIGLTALTNIGTSASQNVAIGYNAGNAITSAVRNVLIGANAGDANAASPDTVAIGYDALTAMSGTSIANTAIGNYALSSLTSSSNYNVALGMRAGATLTTGSGNIIIGSGLNGDGVSTPTTTSSNTLNIGGVIWGTGMNTTNGSTVSTGNIGIGSSTPSSRLTVAGDGWFGGNVLAGNFTSTSTTLTSAFSGPISISGAGTAAKLSVSAGAGMNTNLASFSSAYNIGAGSVLSLSYGGADAGRPLSITDASYNTASLLITRTSGAVTTSSALSGFLASTTYQHTHTGVIGRGGQIIAINNTSPTGILYGLDVSATANLATSVALNVTAASSGGTAYAALFNGGNVGIGTSTPAFPLHVFSTVSSDQTYGYLSSSGSVGTASGVNSYSIKAEGRIIASEFNAVSDARLKDVQFDLDSKIALDAITKLQPVSFTWKNNPTGQPVLGLLAQDVEIVIPNAVSKINNGSLIDQREISYNQIVAVMIGAIKEIKNQLASVTGQVTELMTWFSGDGDRFNVKGMVCVDDVCVSKDQFKQMLLNSGASHTTSVPTPDPTPTPEPDPTPAPDPSSEPDPTPEIEPTPTPEPTPEPEVEPTPAPAPDPTPAPQSEPVPESSPTPVPIE